MTKEQLEKLRGQFLDMCEWIQSTRGDPSKTWQQEAPEYAETIAAIDAAISSVDEPGPLLLEDCPRCGAPLDVRAPPNR